MILQVILMITVTLDIDYKISYTNHKFSLQSDLELETLLMLLI